MSKSKKLVFISLLALIIIFSSFYVYAVGKNGNCASAACDTGLVCITETGTTSKTCQYPPCSKISVWTKADPYRCNCINFDTGALDDCGKDQKCTNSGCISVTPAPTTQTSVAALPACPVNQVLAQKCLCGGRECSNPNICDAAGCHAPATTPVASSAAKCGIGANARVCEIGEKCTSYGCLKLEEAYLPRCDGSGSKKCICSMGLYGHDICEVKDICDTKQGCMPALDMPKKKAGKTCASDAECVDGLTCIFVGGGASKCGKLLPVGASCNVDGQCDFGLRCVSGKCADSRKGGESCSSTKQCPKGLVCDPSEGYCLPEGLSKDLSVKVPMPMPAPLPQTIKEPTPELRPNAIAGLRGECIADANCDPGLICRRFIGESKATCRYPLCDIHTVLKKSCECHTTGAPDDAYYSCSPGQICARGGCHDRGDFCVNDNQCSAPMKCLEFKSSQPNTVLRSCSFPMCSPGADKTKDISCTCMVPNLVCGGRTKCVNKGNDASPNWQCVDPAGTAAGTTTPSGADLSSCKPTTCSVILARVSGKGYENKPYVLAGSNNGLSLNANQVASPVALVPGQKYSVTLSATKQATTAKCLKINGKNYASSSRSFTIWQDAGQTWTFTVQGYADAACTQAIPTARAAVSFVGKKDFTGNPDDDEFNKLKSRFDSLNAQSKKEDLSPKERQQIFEQLKGLRQDIAGFLDKVK